MFSVPMESRLPGHASPRGSEPMALGSPVSSPTGSAPAPGGISYLPPYLIGGPSSSVAPASPQIFNSPPKKFGSAFGPSQASPISVGANGRKTLFQSQSTSTLMSHPPTEKPGGPPVQGLFDSIPSPVIGKTRIDTPVAVTPGATTPGTPGFLHSSGILTPSKSFYQNNSSAFASPAQMDPFYTQGEALSPGDKLDETWVTVFGFPPAAASYILQQFSQYGTVIEHRVAPSGNWIHIHYQAKLQAKKALSKNGKIFGESIMVGVKPCIEVNVMNESGKENSMLESSLNSSVNFSNTERIKRNIRPLTQAYRTAASDHEVTPKHRTPQKSNGIVTKTMEYLLGW